MLLSNLELVPGRRVTTHLGLVQGSTAGGHRAVACARLNLPAYSNPRFPEDEVNVSDRRPLLGFLALAGAVVAVCGAAAVALAFFGGSLAHDLPYSAEEKLIETYARRFPPREHPVENYLQALAERLAAGMALPAGMAVRAHYVDEPAVNAFATLGGHIAVYRVLLERVPDENVLAMVIAHEIGHLQHRHPIRSLGRGVAFGAALSVLSAGAGSQIADRVLGGSGMLTLLTFSRAQEEQADATALEALVAAYGHAGGAPGTFKLLQEAARERGLGEPPKILNTHPLTQERVERLAATIAGGAFKPDGPRTQVPEAVRSAIEKDAKSPKKGRPGAEGGPPG